MTAAPPATARRVRGEPEPEPEPEHGAGDAGRQNAHDHELDIPPLASGADGCTASIARPATSGL